MGINNKPDEKLMMIKSHTFKHYIVLKEHEL